MVFVEQGRKPQDMFSGNELARKRFQTPKSRGRKILARTSPKTYWDHQKDKVEGLRLKIGNYNKFHNSPSPQCIIYQSIYSWYDDNSGIALLAERLVAGSDWMASMITSTAQNLQLRNTVRHWKEWDQKLRIAYFLSTKWWTWVIFSDFVVSLR